MKNFYSIRHIEYLDNGKRKGDFIQYFADYNTAKTLFNNLCVYLRKQNTEDDGWHESIASNDYKYSMYSLERQTKEDYEYITVYLKTEYMFEAIEESF